jgi:DNA-binding MarR family transcriptional regulator
VLLISILLLGGIVWYENQKIQNLTIDHSLIRPAFSLTGPQIDSSIQIYIPRAPIFIQGDEDFITKATTKNWSGEGTIANPIIIEGYTITAVEGPLISISDTTFYFSIRNNLLNGSNAATEGINFYNVQHGTIENNIICNNDATDGGIIFEDYSSNNLIINNYIFGNQMGINVGGNNNCIVNNSIYRNQEMAIWLNIGTSNNTLVGNTIYNNTGAGIQLEQSNSNIISSNHVWGNNLEAIRIEGNTQYNIFTFNNFTDNNVPEHQAEDSGSFNTFGFNYWNDWISPDSNSDGFVDVPYPVKGIAGNQDSHPLVTLALDHSHLMYNPKILLPQTPLTDIVILTWTASLDSLQHGITYTVYYSPDQGEEWIALASNLTATHFNWDTTTVADGSSYLFKIEAKCDEGLIVVEISRTFTITNTFPGDDQFLFQLFIGVVGLIMIVGVSYFLYTFKTRVPETIIDFFQSDQIDFLKSLYGKIMVGLENIAIGVIPEPKGSPLLEPVEPTTLVEYFPIDIKKDLLSGLKGRTVLTLIEIAYQYPEETNPMRLAKTLDIPPTTVSYEINRLMKLEYLEPFVSPQVLKDGRFRNYTITPKGSSFLRILKGALELSIRRLGEKDSYQ